MKSKEYAWAFATESRILCHGVCELVFAHLSAEAAHDDTYLRNGENVNSDPIVILESGLAVSVPFAPKEPVYCNRGLYIEITDGNVKGVFVQWRELRPPD